MLLQILSDTTQMKFYFGVSTFSNFIGLILFSWLGAFTSILVNAAIRYEKAPGSPTHFSANYFWCNNTKRFLIDLFLSVVVIRFLPDILHTFWPSVTANSWTPPWAALVGLVSRGLPTVIKNFRDYITKRTTQGVDNKLNQNT